MKSPKVCFLISFLLGTLAEINGKEVVRCHATFVGTRTKAESIQAQKEHAAWLNSSGSFQANLQFPMGPIPKSLGLNAVAHGGSYSSQSYAPAPMPGKVSENKMRVFTSTEGNTVEARILSINTVNRTARIRTGKGLAYSVPFGRFCESDLSYLKAWWINRNPPRKLSGYKAFLARRKG